MIWQLFYTDPADANGAFVRPYALDPERKLRLAVLQDALERLRRPLTYGSHWHTVAKQTRAHDEERAWLASDSTAHPFTFVVICDALGLDPQAVRRAVLAERRAA